VPSWIGQSADRGILTTRYPRVPATEPEVPATARGPVPDGPVGDAAISSCPVDAIAPEGVDQGRCIRCARCLADGLRWGGPVEAAAATRDRLVRGGSGDGPRPAVRAALPTLGRSLHLFLVDVGSCNACNLEVLAITNPLYDASRLGIFLTNSPRHADVLLVVGAPTEGMAEPLRRAFEAMPGPKAVVVVGACAISAGAFRGNRGVRPSCEGIVPIDLYVPGCPPTPLQVLDALLTVGGRGRREG
jgi:formate hydrogenlyase subunit 7